ALIPVIVALVMLIIAIVDTFTGFNLIGILFFIADMIVTALVAAFGLKSVLLLSYSIVLLIFLFVMASSIAIALSVQVKLLKTSEPGKWYSFLRNEATPFEFSLCLLWACIFAFYLFTLLLMRNGSDLFVEEKSSGYLEVARICFGITTSS